VNGSPSNKAFLALHAELDLIDSLLIRKILLSWLALIDKEDRNSSSPWAKPWRQRIADFYPEAKAMSVGDTKNRSAFVERQAKKWALVLAALPECRGLGSFFCLGGRFSRQSLYSVFRGIVASPVLWTVFLPERSSFKRA
jgi:hypothetical protein